MELNGATPTVEQVTALALTNYGHFTSMVVEHGRVRGLALHLHRLARDCRALFGTDLDIERVRHHVRHALGEDGGRTVVRVTVYDPALDVGSIGAGADPHVLVTTRPAPASTPPPLRLRTSLFRRENPALKHVGLFAALDRRRSAQREGFDDALFVDHGGRISELVTSNIGFVRDGHVIWPRAEWLAGVTMTLLDRALGQRARFAPLTLAEVSGMDAAFATNAAVGVRAVAAVDATAWPTDHRVLHELRELYSHIPAELV